MESHCTKHRHVLAQSHIQSYTFDCNSQLATKPKNCRVLNKVAISYFGWKNTLVWLTLIDMRDDTFISLSFLEFQLNFYQKFPNFLEGENWHQSGLFDTLLSSLSLTKNALRCIFLTFIAQYQWGLRYTCTLNRRLHFLTLWHWAEIRSSIGSWACHASMDYELNRNGPENIWIEQWNHKKILFLFARSLHNNQSAANNAAIFQSQGSYVY